MTHDLERVFGELGLAQYLDAFLDQGFDTWDTILDIQESDLDALGVKLGHRRKLQRRIANARGIAPSISLSSIKQAAPEDGKQGTPRKESSKSETVPDQVSSGNNNTNGVTKRKYRRHPKPDENAPERPPSAYVLFSNKMREDLKSQNLTFTEIAKLVGENWQSLAPAERETYESQANAAKEKYHRDLAEYKKTPEYRKYAHYLQDFKDKQAKQNQANEMAKRAKIEPARLRHGSSSSSATPNGTISSGSGSGSSSERLPASEPPTRKRRVDSTASLAESHHSSSGFPPISHRTSLEETGPSPRSLHFDSGSPRESLYRQSRRPSSWAERDGADTGQQPLPSLSDMLEDGKRLTPAEFPSGRWERRQPLPDAQPDSKAVPPLLHDESSSYGSSNSSGVAVPGRPGADSALPIHALLSNKGTPSQDDALPSSNGKTAPVSNPNQPLTVSGYGFQTGSSVFQRMNVQRSPDGDVLMTSEENSTPAKGSSTDEKAGYNGMDALLRAGEIVGRRNPQ